MIRITLMSLLLVACAEGKSYSSSPEDVVPLEVNVQRAIQNLHDDGQWLDGISKITQEDRDPPPEASWATVACPDHVILYNTTFDKPVDFFEPLLVHEAYEIRHGCKDRDAQTAVFVRCFRDGNTYEHCQSVI